MRSLAALTLLPWLLAAEPEASRLTVRQYPADRFAISVPADWVEIPKSELEQMTTAVRQAAPNAKPQPYNYGFQQDAQTKYPRLVVQIKTGRWGENIFEELPKTPETDPALSLLKLENSRLVRSREKTGMAAIEGSRRRTTAAGGTLGTASH